MMIRTQRNALSEVWEPTCVAMYDRVATPVEQRAWRQLIRRFDGTTPILTVAAMLEQARGRR